MYICGFRAGEYEFCPKGKIDNTHLNIYGGRIVAGLAVDALMEEVSALDIVRRIKTGNPLVFTATI